MPITQAPLIIKQIEMESKLEVKIFNSRLEMGEAAAAAVGSKIEELLAQRNEVNMIFAAAPSQNEFLASLIKKDLDWSRVNAFHMDEYIGLPEEAPQGFGNFLKERIFGKLPFKAIHYLNGNAGNNDEEAVRYGELLKEKPVDIVCMGIGENGHIAFNDPHVADFNDPVPVKIVDLDDACRRQQVNDGCFETLQDVPRHALTLTVPALMNATYVYCMVPGELKADAVYNTIHQEKKPQYPSTALRDHPHAILFLDKQSSKNLSK